MRINKDEKGRVLYYIAVDAILINTEGKILLQRRANTGWNDGKYNLVGGHIEDNETIEECICRELKEEIGIEVNKQDVKIVHCMQHKTDRETIQFYVLCTKWEGIPTIQPEIINNEKIFKSDKIDWFSIYDLPDEIIPSAKLALESFKRSESFSRMGY